VQDIYRNSIDHLRDSLQRFVAGENFDQRVRACYPFVRVHTSTVARADSRLSYGFVAGPGTYETTLTRPDLFGRYYLEQFSLLLRNHSVELESAPARCRSRCTSPSPSTHVEATMSAERRLLMRDLFDLPDLAAMDDGIANGTYEPRPGEAQPLALFTAPRVDYSLQRLRHYTGTAPEHFQNFVLFTNYQFYIDEFIKLGHQMMADPQPTTSLRRAGQRGHAPRRQPRVARRRGRQRAAAAAADAGLPPHARRPQRHHHGQHRRRPGQRQDHHRPHRRAAPARLADAGPLRRPAQLAAAGRLRAGPRLCARGPCARRGPAAVGADSGAGRGAAGAGTGRGRRDPAAGLRAQAIMRTGTVASTDNRNWELLPNRNVASTPERRFSQSRAVALDMESATIAANGFRFRVPYGTCCA
jgi:AMP nucleosidase